MKKKILFFAMVLFVVCLLTICVSAVEVDGIYYSFTNTDAYPGYDGTATVTNENRTGTLANVVIPEIVEYDSDSDGTPDKKYIVTTIADSAFGSINSTVNTTVTSVFIPKTIKAIGTHAFRRCSALEAVVIEARGYNPSTKEDYTAEVTFSNAEFYDCDALLSVDMSNSNVVQLGNDCFTSCALINSIPLSKNIKRIYKAFSSCPNLTIDTANFETLEEISGGAFYNMTLTGNLDLKLPNMKSMSSDNAFRGTAITSVDFTGASLKTLPAHAFRDCKSLTKVVLPDGLNEISASAFYGCSSLTDAYIPRTVTVFGGEAFRGAKIGGDLIFDTVVSIGQHAFRETQITSLVILNGTIKGENGEADKVLTSLENNAAFWGCTKLEILVLPETVVHSGGYTFDNCSSLKYIVASKDWTSVSSKPSKADLIIRGTEADALNLASAWSGWSVAPFSEFDPATAGTKTIYYGAVNAKDSVTTFVSFDGFDKEFSSWDSITNKKTAYAPIFEAQGYSTNADKTSIATGFSIAKASLDAYTSLIGGEVNFGIAIFNPKYLGADSFFNAEGGLNANGGCLTVDIGTEYSTCSLSVQGFNSGNSGIELVFVGFAYTDDISKATLIQKDYVGTTDAPVSSPMVSKVTRNEGTLYTTTIASVCTPAEISTGKDGLGEFTA